MASLEMLNALYENEPRITVDTSASPYYMHKHGRTVLFYHHGHLSRFDKVASVMASMFRKRSTETVITLIATWGTCTTTKC